MTVIGKDRYSDNMLKDRRYKASKCPQCKARTHEEAEKLCRPTQDITGEYSCAGDESCLNPFGVHWDVTGRACELVAADARAEAKTLDEWCDAEAAKMEQTPPPAEREATEGGAHEKGIDWDNPENAAVKLFVGYDVEGYVEEYEFCGDDGYYSPNEQERVLLVDAIYGVVSDIHEKMRVLTPQPVGSEKEGE